MAVKGFPGKSSVSSKYVHPKVGGFLRRSDNRTGKMAGLPPKAVNPYQIAKMVTNRAAGTPKLRGKGPY